MKVSPQYWTFLLHIQDISIPKNSQEALRNIQWKEVMDEEMRALLQNNTWEIVDLPKEKNLLDVYGCIPLNVRQMVVLTSIKPVL